MFDAYPENILEKLNCAHELSQQENNKELIF